jgi:hypothetical protein
MMFWIFWSIDAITAAILVYFFVVGLVDGSVTSFNMWLWLIFLAAMTALLWGSHMLRSAERESLATTLLGILAIPSVLCGLFFLAMIILNPRWN